MNFIECEENKELVNLDNVSYIFPAESPDTSKRPHKIYFVYTAMNSDECMETVWSFDDIKQFERVLLSFTATRV